MCKYMHMKPYLLSFSSKFICYTHTYTHTRRTCVNTCIWSLTCCPSRASLYATRPLIFMDENAGGTFMCVCMCMWVSVCIYVCVCVCVCKCVRVFYMLLGHWFLWMSSQVEPLCVCVLVFVYICNYIHACYMHASYTDMQASKYTYIRTYIHTYMHEYIQEFSVPVPHIWHLIICVCVCVNIHTYTHTYTYSAIVLLPKTRTRNMYACA
jgi:hypothetical protein